MIRDHACHHAAGMVAGLTAAAVTHLPAWQAAGFAALSALTGPAPDIDQHGWWRDTLGHLRPFEHRQLTHWWGTPAGMAVALLAGGHASWWWAWAALTGVASHLAWDFAFGARDPYAGRGPGIPLAPWGWHVGLGLKSGGFAESLTAVLVLPVVGLWAAAILTHLPIGSL